MSSIAHIMGRPTKDPVMQQSQNGGNEYILSDIAVTQRSQNGENETVFYNCFFNKFQGQRLLKAGVKQGTCLWIYGSLDLHPFIYQKGKNQGQPGINAKITVADWQFAIANRPENAPAAQGAPTPETPTGSASNGGYNTGGAPNINNYSAGGTMPQQNMAPAYGQNYPAQAAPQAQANYGNAMPNQAYATPPANGFSGVQENNPAAPPQQLPFN